MLQVNRNMRYYPVCIDTSINIVVVYGAGKTAYEKIQSLLKSSAYIFVFSKHFSLDIINLAKENEMRIELMEADAREDLWEDSCIMAYACTDSDEVNEIIRKYYAKRNIPVYVSGETGMSSFITPQIAEYKDIVIAVNSEQHSHNLSRMLRNHIEAMLNDELIEKLELIGKIYAKAEKRNIYQYYDKTVYESHIRSSLEELREEYCDLYELDPDKGIIEQDEKSIEVDDDMVFLSSMYEIDEDELPLY